MISSLAGSRFYRFATTRYTSKFHIIKYYNEILLIRYALMSNQKIMLEISHCGSLKIAF